MIRPLLSLILASMMLAQTETGSIGGVVREPSAGSPVADATLYLDRNSKTEIEVKVDAQGRYTVRNVVPGQHRLSAEAPRVGQGIPVYATKIVHVSAGQELANINFDLELPARISGKVIDQNKEPVPGITVMLIAREYSLGALRHVFAGMANTDDQGQYTLQSVKPGRAFLVMAQKRTFRIDAISDAPADPKLRKPAYATTFYPGTPTVEGAQSLTLRAGEDRDGLDLRLLRTPAYCIEGVVHGARGPEALRFSIIDRQATSGASGDGAMFVASPSGKAEADGKIRVCNLYPGEYELSAHSQDNSMPQSYGTATVTVVDRDVRNVSVTARPTVTVAGEVTWYGEAPDPPLTEQIAVSLQPMTRAPWQGEPGFQRTSIPGSFSFTPLLVDSYLVRVATERRLRQGTDIRRA